MSSCSMIIADMLRPASIAFNSATARPENPGGRVATLDAQNRLVSNILHALELRYSASLPLPLTNLSSELDHAFPAAHWPCINDSSLSLDLGDSLCGHEAGLPGLAGIACSIGVAHTNIHGTPLASPVHSSIFSYYHQHAVKMPYSEDNTHGEPIELISAAPDKPLRPMNADEKLAATTCEVTSRNSESEGSRTVEHDNSTAAPMRRGSGVLPKLRNFFSCCLGSRPST